MPSPPAPVAKVVERKHAEGHSDFQVLIGDYPVYAFSMQSVCQIEADRINAALAPILAQVRQQALEDAAKVADITVARKIVTWTKAEGVTLAIE